MIYKYIGAAAISLAIIVAAYVLKFYVGLDYVFSSDTAAWGNFGSYVGGLAGPVLSFISVVFVIKALRLQNEANLVLRNQLENSEKSEKLRSFSDLFFNMIDSQKKLLDSFGVVFCVNGVDVARHGVDAILEIEDDIQFMKDHQEPDGNLVSYVEFMDSGDQIFGIIRAFYISVRMVSEKLSDKNGFSVVERKEFLNTLVNFTDFAQLRLVLMGIQFLDYYPASKYLRNDDEFKSILSDVGLHLDPY